MSHSYQFWKWQKLPQNPGAQMPAKMKSKDNNLKTTHMGTIIIFPILHEANGGKRSEIMPETTLIS